MSSKRGQGGGNDQGGEHRPGDPGEDKVIRLPRDWLGPREDLVPFGPSADRHIPEPSESDDPSGEWDAPGETSSRPPLEEVSSPPPDPVSPDDFWGERSAALQGPLDEADHEAVVGDEAGPTLRRRPARVLAAATAAAVALAILTLSLLGQSSSGPERSRITAGAGSGGGVDSAGGRGTLWPLPSHTRLALQRPGRSGHARPKRKEPTLPQQGAALAADYVRPASAAQSSTASGNSGSESGSGGTTSSSANQSQVTFSPPTASAPTGSGATTGTTTRSSTTPTTTGGTSRHKAPAFGATGALSPGHSHTG